MSLLAIDTSTDMASIALSVHGQLYHFEKSGASSHAQSLLPAIDDLLQKASLQLNELDGIVVGQGPGSFTGIRVAAAVVKGLAFPWNLPVYPVSGLAAMAYAARKEYPNQRILSLLDARMRQVYWALYEDDPYNALEHVSNISEIKLLGDVVICGHQYELYREEFPKSFANKTMLDCKPEATIMLEMVKKGLILPLDAKSLEPHYVRNQVTQGSKNG